jgi:hypothetical protein
VQSGLVSFLSSLLTVALTLAATWFVGHRLATTWAIRQKRKELALLTMERFYGHYGEFSAIWKLWREANRDKFQLVAKLEERKTSLLERAAAMEAGVEATLLKLASEQFLNKSDQVALGRLRQCFQFARECISTDRAIPYGSSEDPKYVEFKTLATTLGTILGGAHLPEQPSREQAIEAFLEITSNRHEDHSRPHL